MQLLFQKQTAKSKYFKNYPIFYWDQKSLREWCIKGKYIEGRVRGTFLGIAYWIYL